MPKNKGKKREKVFEANLKLVTINRYVMRYEVVNAKGLDADVTHIEFARHLHSSDPVLSPFPIDDDFNMDFLEADLDSDAYLPPDPNELIDVDAVKASKKKQKEFRKWRNLRLVIADA